MVQQNKNNDQDQDVSSRTPGEMTENDLDQVSGGVQSTESKLVDKQLEIKKPIDTGYVYHPIKSNASSPDLNQVRK